MMKRAMRGSRQREGRVQALGNARTAATSEPPGKPGRLTPVKGFQDARLPGN